MSPLRRWLPLGWVMLVLAVTLGPAMTSGEAPAWPWITWGSRSTADLLMNVALFVPFGAAVLWGGRSTAVAVLGAALLSTGIETAQAIIPGRDANLIDVFANTSGAWLGALAMRRWRAIADAWVAGRKWPLMTYTVLLYLLLLAPVILFRPGLPESTWYGQWTPRLGHLEAYRGKVRSATIDARPVPSGRSSESRAIGRALLTGAPIRIDFIAAPAPTRIAPIFSIYDELQREVLLVGAQGEDLVVRLRRVAEDAHLYPPLVRFPHLLRSLTPGEEAVVRLQRTGAYWCASVNGETACREEAGMIDAWTLLTDTSSLNQPFEQAVGLVIVGLLTLPLGLLARSAGVATLHALALVLLLLVAPWIAGIGTTPTSALAVVVLAVAVGAVASRPAGGAPLRGLRAWRRYARAGNPSE